MIGRFETPVLEGKVKVALQESLDGLRMVEEHISKNVPACREKEEAFRKLEECGFWIEKSMRRWQATENHKAISSEAGVDRELR